MEGDRREVHLTEEENEAVVGLLQNITDQSGSEEHKMEKFVNIIYNLCNEPWLKYSMILVVDKGLTKPTFTSSQFKRGYVLYMENHFHRYELCFNGKKVVKGGLTSQAPDTQESQNHHSNAPNGDGMDVDGEIVDVFCFSQCKKNLPQKMMLEHGIPHPVDLLEVLHDELVWEDVLWSDTGVWIGGKEYKVVRILFISPIWGIASIV